LVLKRLGLYTLLFVVGFHLVGHLAVFKLKQILIFIEMDNNEGEKKETFVVDPLFYKSNLRRHGKEIVIHGKMYDIKSTKHKGGKIIITAIHDIKEESLFQRLSNYLSASDDDKQASKSLSRLFKLDFFSPQSQVCFYNFSTYILYPDLIESTLSGFREFTTPPPQYI